MRTYGRKSNEDLYKKSNHNWTTQKLINLVHEVLNEFKGKRHYVTMDLAYMDNIWLKWAVTNGSSTWLGLHN